MPIKIMEQVKLQSLTMVVGGYPWSLAGSVLQLRGQQWTELASLQTPRYWHACAARYDRQEIVVVGG